MNKAILFGAGAGGKEIMEFLSSQNIAEYVYAFCDNDNKKVGTSVKGKKVLSFEEAKKTQCSFVITVESDAYKNELSKMLEDAKIEYYYDIFSWFHEKSDVNETEINRKYCAYYHIEGMDDYFERAENAIADFWDDKSPFYLMFKQLDVSNVIELACGRGRHVPQYYEYADYITLVDVVEKNIEICKKRFENYVGVSYYNNNGYDLSELDSNKYTALFSYDAMVHFEMFDIYNYLKETYRVLGDGGKALFHHSNLALEYDQSFSKPYNPGGRSFMTKKLFAYLAFNVGFDIVEQRVIDWSLPQMDCLTLLQKKAR